MNDKELRKAKVFFIYLDRTTDLNTEKMHKVFYVGKGMIGRVNLEKPRNKYWGRIATKYRFVREVIFATKDESLAFAMEKEKIREHKTFERYWKDGSGWGANFTEGGDGKSGWKASEETRRKQSIAMMGKKGHKHTAEARKRIGDAHRGEKSPNFGRTPSDETRKRMSDSHKTEAYQKFIRRGEDHPNYGKQASEETRRKMSEARRGPKHPRFGTHHTAEAKQKLSEAQRGEKSHSAKLTWAQVNEMRARYLSSDFSSTQEELAREYGVSKPVITNILGNKRWKDDEYAVKLDAMLGPDKLEGRKRKWQVSAGEDRPTAKLTKVAVDQIRIRYANGCSMQSLADEHSVSVGCILKVIRNLTWYCPIYAAERAQKGKD